MARAIDADELEMFPYSEGAGTEEQISEWIEQTGLSEDDTAGRARDLCWKVIDGFINVVKTQPTLTQPNEGGKDKNVPTNGPLTLEELREMDGDPVWGKSLITGKPGEWFILRVVEMSKTWFIACAGAEQGFGDKDTYGETWVAYRRPPEGDDNT